MLICHQLRLHLAGFFLTGELMSTIKRLIAELAAGKLPAAKEIEELAYTLHSAMLDAPEMTWMPISFEEMGDAMHKAIECAAREEVPA